MTDLNERLPKPWIVYDPLDGISAFATEAEAVNEAESLIEGYLQETWDENVEGIVVARLTHYIAERNVIERDDPRWDEVTGYRTDVERWVDYVLEPVSAAPTEDPSDGQD